MFLFSIYLQIQAVSNHTIRTYLLNMFVLSVGPTAEHKPESNFQQPPKHLINLSQSHFLHIYDNHHQKGKTKHAHTAREKLY